MTFKAPATGQDVSEFLLEVFTVLPRHPYLLGKLKSQERCRAAIEAYFQSPSDMTQAQAQCLLHFFRGDRGLFNYLPDHLRDYLHDVSFNAQINDLRHQVKRLQTANRTQKEIFRRQQLPHHYPLWA